MKHIPRKRFGQNFLVSQSVINDIVSVINPQPTDTMVEIGPGLGALTGPLTERLDHLHVVEIDRDLIAGLQQRFPKSKVTVHEGDALKFDFSALGNSGNGLRNGLQNSLRIVGNLPYNISTPILFHLAECASQVRDMHFMLQKEVVDRMVAEPGSANVGRLSIMLQYRFEMELLLHVPPNSFNPPPKVESAVVRMQPRPLKDLKAKDHTIFARIVTAAFSMRRKMLRNTLRDLVSEADLTALGIAPTQRAEEVSVNDFVRIANCCVK